MSLTERFTKAYDQLITLGLSPRLVLLYGKLAFHAGADGKCYPTWKTLAREIGVKNRTTVYRLLALLKDLGLIDWHRRGPHSNQYTLLTPDPAQVQKRLQKCNLKRLQSRNVKRLQECNPEKNHHQKKNLKESPTPTPPPPGEGAPHTKSPRTAVNPSRKRAPGRTQTVINADDDEHCAKPTSPTLSPEQEFCQRLRKRHGASFDVDTCVACLKRQMDRRGISFPEFLGYDAQRTTAEVSNPTGYYTSLIKDLARLQRDQIFTGWATAFQTVAQTIAPVELDQYGRCAKCHGCGLLGGGGFCDGCQLGHDLAVQARRKPKAEPLPQKKGAA
jgi:hypothetical protein